MSRQAENKGLAWFVGYAFALLLYAAAFVAAWGALGWAIRWARAMWSG